MGKRILITALIAFLPFIQLYAQLIAANQKIEWNPGIPGGIPKIESPVANILDFSADPKGTKDSHGAFMAAIQSLPATGGVVLVPTGIFLLQSTLRVERAGIVFRGEGQTSRLMSAAKGNSVEVVSWKQGSWQPVVAGFNKDSKTVEVKDGSVFKPGSFAEIEQENDSLAMYTKPEWKQDWAENAVGQFFGVEVVNGNLVTFKSALHFDYSSDFNVQIRPVQMVVGVGFENFYIEKTVPEGHTLFFQNAARCWVSEVESNHTCKSHVNFTQSFGCTVRESFFHRSFDYGGGGSGYGVECGKHTTDVLAENNVFDSLRHSMLVQVGANGNVFGYNYSCHTAQGDGENNLNQGWVPPDISIHGHYTFMNLFEGNDVEEIGIADYWGPAGPGNTFFRNRVNGEGIFLYDISLNQNIIGNLSPQFTDEKNVSGKSIVHGNKIENAVSWAPGISKELPPSMYHKSIPSFFTDGNWPAFGPDVRQKLRLPSRIRYEKLFRK